MLKLEIWNLFNFLKGNERMKSTNHSLTRPKWMELESLFFLRKELESLEYHISLLEQNTQ